MGSSHGDDIKKSMSQSIEISDIVGFKSLSLSLNLENSPWMAGFPGGASDKESACQCRRCKRHRCDPWVAKIPWNRKWQPTPVYLPESSMDRAWSATVHRLAELDTTECVHMCTHTHTHTHTYPHPQREPPPTHVYLPRSNCM